MIAAGLALNKKRAVAGHAPGWDVGSRCAAPAGQRCRRRNVGMQHGAKTPLTISIGGCLRRCACMRLHAPPFPPRIRSPPPSPSRWLARRAYSRSEMLCMGLHNRPVGGIATVIKGKAGRDAPSVSCGDWGLLAGLASLYDQSGGCEGQECRAQRTLPPAPPSVRCPNRAVPPCSLPSASW